MIYPWAEDGGGMGESMWTGIIVRETQLGVDCNIPWLICVEIVLYHFNVR